MCCRFFLFGTNRESLLRLDNKDLLNQVSSTLGYMVRHFVFPNLDLLMF